jgi:nitroimidazol reductase NimA-like FMN-containing flavoprotein (pyridoxamine 5'-phosphate oxidase superfamily)
MSEAEVDNFLGAAWTCRVASNGSSGPHVSPLWFLWQDRTLWLHSLSRSQRWTDIERDPRTAVVVDLGERYDELRGVELSGRAEAVGEVPRTGAEANAELDAVESGFAAKYLGGRDNFGYDGRHAWLRLVPEKIVSWDFRKL